MAATTSSALDHSFSQNRDNSKFVSKLSFDGDSKNTEKLSKVETDHNYQQQQSNQPLPEYVKTFSQVLASIGYMNINEDIYHKLRAMYPIVDLSDIDSGLVTNADLNLANLYKCDVYHHGCYYTASNGRAFRQHLSSEHSAQSLLCFYCTKAGHGDNCDNAEHSQFSQPEQLIEHIKSQHKDIKYQCNLCFYRAFSADHVFIHQATEHLVNFEQTLKRAILDIEDELSPIEREFVQQTTDSNDDDTEVEDNEDDECGTVSSNQSSQQLPFKELCKIIICEAIDNNGLDKVTTEYFHAHALGLEKLKLEKYSNSFLQCAYCPTELATISSTSPNGSGEDFWVHSVTAHPEFPILAYDLSLIKRSSNDISVDATSRVKKYASDIDMDTIADLNRIDDDLAERIVTNFREQLASNSLNQSYEETLMKSAFDYYENLESILMNTPSTSTGIKRKLKNDTTDGSAAGTTNEANSPIKRRRLFERFSISESTFQKTKRMARILATAAVAIGVYHLTHFLPDSVQAYLN